MDRILYLNHNTSLFRAGEEVDYVNQYFMHDGEVWAEAVVLRNAVCVPVAWLTIE